MKEALNWQWRLRKLDRDLLVDVVSTLERLHSTPASSICHAHRAALAFASWSLYSRNDRLRNSVSHAPFHTELRNRLRNFCRVVLLRKSQSKIGYGIPIDDTITIRNRFGNSYRDTDSIRNWQSPPPKKNHCGKQSGRLPEPNLPSFLGDILPFPNTKKSDEAECSSWGECAFVMLPAGLSEATHACWDFRSRWQARRTSLQRKIQALSPRERLSPAKTQSHTHETMSRDCPCPLNHGWACF